MVYLSAIPHLSGLDEVNAICQIDLSLSKFNTLFSTQNIITLEKTIVKPKK